MKKGKLWVGIISAILVLFMGVYALYTNWYWDNHVQIGADIYAKDIVSLDLTGIEMPETEMLQSLPQLQQLDVRGHRLSVDEYEALCEALSGCDILWKVPFQNQYLEETIRQLKVTQLSENDLDMLKYFPDLNVIDATGCYDYGMLQELQANRPDLQIIYTVEIDELEYQPDVAELTLENTDGVDLLAALPYLPCVTDVYLKGTLPDPDTIYEWMCLYPNVVFHWDFEVLGVQTSSTATELILNDIAIENTEAVESVLKYFYSLSRVEMCNCGIPSEEMDALWKRHPETRFVWTINIRDETVRTDILALIPYKLGYDIDHPLFDKDCRELKYCVDLICLDMGHMKIRDVSFLNYMPKMQYLVLVDMPCRDFSAIAKLTDLIYLELFNVKFSETEILLNLTKLQDLNIGYTPTPNLDVLTQMTWLKRLWVPGTKLSEKEYQRLQQQLPDTQVVMHVVGSTGGHWRDNDNYRAMRDLLGMHYME